jgi:hypothetical protein
MSLSYTYQVISVDEQARCMEVVYASPGRQTLHIGARLPYVGETLESIIEMYAPVAYWREQEAVVAPPEVGVGGSLEAIDPTPPLPPTSDQLRKFAYQNEADPIFFKYQRGEATQQEWLDKIAEIKARYPD